MARFVAAVSCAHLLLLAAYVRLGAVRPWQTARDAFGEGGVTWIAMYVSAALAPFLLGAVLWAVDAWLRRRPVRWAGTLRESLIVLLSLFGLFTFTNALALADPIAGGALRAPLVTFVNRHIVLAVAVSLLSILLALWFCLYAAGYRRRLVRVCRATLLILSPAVLLSVGGLGYILAVSPVEATQHLAGVEREFVPEDGSPGDVIMLVFDGLSYDAVFSNAQVNEQLPAFRELAGQSVVFHNMHGFRGATQENVPSMMTGEVYARHQRFDPRYGVTVNLADGTEVRLQDRRNLFDVFHERGYHLLIHGTGVRYCTTYAKGRGACRSSSFDLHTPKRISGAVLEPYWLAVESMVPYQLETMFSSFVSTREAWRLAFHHDVLASLEHAPAGSFVFAHYPVPHHPYVRYDPVAHTLLRARQDDTGVLLVDQFLQELIERLQQLGRWEHALVIVVSDHPDRNRDSQGTHVPMLVKLPAAHGRADYGGYLTHAHLLQMVETLFIQDAFSLRSALNALTELSTTYEIVSVDTFEGLN